MISFLVAITNEYYTSQVFCHVAARLNAEGAEKTWDQCRIKLKNLKSQYRYIKVCIYDYILIGDEACEVELDFFSQGESSHGRRGRPRGRHHHAYARPRVPGISYL